MNQHLTAVFLYDEGTCASLRLHEVARAVQAITGLGAEVRPEFVRYWVEQGRSAPEGLSAVGKRLVEGHPEALARALVGARVHDPLRRFKPERQPTPVEIAAERRALERPGQTSVGILYDGVVVQWLMAELGNWGQAPSLQNGDCTKAPGVWAPRGLSPFWREGACPQFPPLHAVVTGRLLGTYSEEDHRWHAHTILCGEPCLISTSGLVQAPARPREYYQGQGLATARLAPREVVEAELEQRMAGRMLIKDDPRITEVVVGYVLQAVAFQATGSAFCAAPTCRLYNARRQEELIRAQLSAEAGLCPQHQALFAALRGAAE